MIHLQTIADELGMSREGARYRANTCNCEVVKWMVSDNDADIIRNFWEDKKVDPPEFIKDFMAEVKEEMAEQNVSGNRLSVETGYSRGMISLILNGKRRVTFDFIIRVSEALNMKPVLCLMEKE